MRIILASTCRKKTISSWALRRISMSPLPVRSRSRRSSLRMAVNDMPGHGSAKNSFSSLIFVSSPRRPRRRLRSRNRSRCRRHWSPWSRCRGRARCSPGSGDRAGAADRRLDDALVARRADVELLVFVFRLEGIRLDGAVGLLVPFGPMSLRRRDSLSRALRDKAKNLGSRLRRPS